MRLRVRVELCGEVIEDGVVRVSDGLRLGEHDDAVVAFPGLDLLLQHDPGADAVRVRGHRLRPGERLQLGVDDVVVHLEPVAEALLPRTPLWRGDIALPVLLLATILLTLTLQTATEVLNAKADVSSAVVRRVEALLLPPEVDPPGARPAPAPAPAGPRTIPPARYVDEIR